jgi:hypothetical protein
MSVPGSGWGYDKDIAGSLHDIAETLDKLLIHVTGRSEISQEDAQKAVAVSSLGTVSGFADWLDDAIKTPDGFQKAKKLRSILAHVTDLRNRYQKQLDEMDK